MQSPGFTLLELLVVLALAALSLNFAIVAANDLHERRALATYANRLEQSLRFARTLALSSGKRVSVCPSEDGRACDDDGDYTNGWIVFSEDDAVAAVHPKLPEPWRIKTKRLGEHLSFKPDGGATRAGRILLCSTRDAELRHTAVVNAGGLVRAGDDQAPCT